MKTRRNWVKRVWILLPALVGIAAAVLINQAFSTDAEPVAIAIDDDVAIRHADPASLQLAVDWADAIVVATVTGIERVGEEGPYDQDPNAEVRTDGNAIASAGLVHTYYRLNIDQTLVNDGNVHEAPLLRLGGTIDVYGPEIGGRYLMILGRNSDNASYGITGDWGLVNLDKPASVVDFLGDPVSFARGQTLHSFMSDVPEAVEAKLPYGERGVRTRTGWEEFR